jgi:hypothetical protein
MLLNKRSVIKMPIKFDIQPNDYLFQNTIGYYNRNYLGFNRPNNPNFLNTLKNTFNTENLVKLLSAQNEVMQILENDIKDIMGLHMTKCVCVCVPRAKALNTYTNSQLLFKDAISRVITTINKTKNLFQIQDGTDCITRINNTRTTHLPERTGRTTISGQDYKNDGSMPYPGIIKDTCQINKNKIYGKDIILIDDIYTKSVNIDEDCIQAIYDNGANNIIFYAIVKTGR